MTLDEFLHKHYADPYTCGAASMLEYLWTNGILETYELLTELDNLDRKAWNKHDKKEAEDNTIWSKMPQEYKQALTESMELQNDVVKQLMNLGKDYSVQANTYNNQTQQAIADAKQSLATAETRAQQMGQQGNQMLGDAKNELTGRLDSLQASTYGTSAQDFFNKSLDAGNTQGVKQGTIMGQMAQGQAAQAARGAGMSRAAAAGLGSGAAGNAVQQGYLQGMNTGQSAYQTGAANMNASGQSAANSIYGASAQQADNLQKLGQQGYENTSNTANTNINANAGMASNFINAIPSLLAKEGGRVVRKGVLQDRNLLKGDE
jgi:hypothetical protein